jgi:hypothetical protein
MNKYLEDPVLTLTAGTLRVLRWAVLAMAVATAIICVLFIVAMVVTQGEVAGDMKEARESMMIFVPAGGIICFLLARFARLLRELVLSVRDGQPLTIVNAERLRSMGWLSLGIQGVILLMAVVFALLGNGSIVDVDMVYDLIASVLMAAVLFILARVFEHGARMQEELEGTV